MGVPLNKTKSRNPGPLFYHPTKILVALSQHLGTHPSIILVLMGRSGFAGMLLSSYLGAVLAIILAPSHRLGHHKPPPKKWGRPKQPNLRTRMIDDFRMIILDFKRFWEMLRMIILVLHRH